ncbi:MAG: glutathione S-transferase family protein [Stenotrophomonas sp.]|nr:glutathione S-transferase family protein [Stenotrophomonas sp.]
MTPILFYGVPSGCSFGSIVALEWLRQPYHLCRIDMPGQVQGEDYRRLNPLGETPTLCTAQGELLSESLAILNHRLAYLNTSFFGAYAPLWHALEHAEGDDGKALRAYGTTKVRQAHQALEQMLSTGPWLLGEQRSFADAYFAGIARWNDYHQVVDRREFPRVQQLFERLQDDAGVQFAHAIEAQRPATSSGGFLGEVRLEDVLEAAAA